MVATCLAAVLDETAFFALAFFAGADFFAVDFCAVDFFAGAFFAVDFFAGAALFAVSDFFAVAFFAVLLDCFVGDFFVLLEDPELEVLPVCWSSATVPPGVARRCAAVRAVPMILPGPAAIRIPSVRRNPWSDPTRARSAAPSPG